MSIHEGFIYDLMLNKAEKDLIRVEVSSLTILVASWILVIISFGGVIPCVGIVEVSASIIFGASFCSFRWNCRLLLATLKLSLFAFDHNVIMAQILRGVHLDKADFDLPVRSTSAWLVRFIVPDLVNDDCGLKHVREGGNDLLVAVSINSKHVHAPIVNRITTVM